jgi:cysteine desulfurase/selenocysteine lyase
MSLRPERKRAAPVVTEEMVARWRADFPILATEVRGRPLVYLDSAASAQKPRAVIAAMVTAMERHYANVHRGIHWLSERATEAYEGARARVARFINAPAAEEVVFTRNSTEALNLVAHSFTALMAPGEAVVISEMEHHSNLVPWQMQRDARGIELRIARVNEMGELDLDDLEAKLADGKVKLVAITHMSNVLGTCTPAARIAALAHAAGAAVLFDGSQAIVHRPVDVQAIGADFYAFTGHKLYGPSGIGVLWARREWLERMPPFLGGGEMIATVSFERATWAPPPHKFEAGTPPIVEAVGLAAAIDYLEGIGYEAILAHEAALVDHALRRLSAIPGLTLWGRAQDRGGVVSFTLEGVHPHDLSTLLDRAGIAVRAGNHCAEPLMQKLGVPGTTRASFGLYTTHEEIETLAEALERVREFFA